MGRNDREGAGEAEGFLIQQSTCTASLKFEARVSVCSPGHSASRSPFLLQLQEHIMCVSSSATSPGNGCEDRWRLSCSLMTKISCGCSSRWRSKGGIPCPDRRKWATQPAPLAASGGGSYSGGYFYAGHGRLGTDPTSSQDSTCQQDHCDFRRLMGVGLSRHGEIVGSPRHSEEAVQSSRVAGCGFNSTEMRTPRYSSPIPT